MVEVVISRHGVMHSNHVQDLNLHILPPLSPLPKASGMRNEYILTICAPEVRLLVGEGAKTSPEQIINGCQNGDD